MLAYQAYKSYKQKQQDRSNAGYERKLSTESDTTPLNAMDLEEGAPQQGIKREGTFSEAQLSKKAARNAWISLGISLLVEVILPVILYVSSPCLDRCGFSMFCTTSTEPCLL
jgi:hypothetical protein